jgi:hypothetical protein
MPWFLNIFFPHNIQFIRGTHWAHYPVGGVSCFPPSRSEQGMKLTSFLSLVPRFRKNEAVHPLPYTLTWQPLGQCCLYFVCNSRNSYPLVRVKRAKVTESIANLTGYCIDLNTGHEYFFLIHHLKHRDFLIMSFFSILILVTTFHKFSGEHKAP